MVASARATGLVVPLVLVAMGVAAGCGSSGSGDDETDEPSTSAEAGTDPSTTDPNLLTQDELFQCNGQVSDAPGRMRRLNRWQWTRNVGGAITRSWTGFSYFDNPLDPSSGERYSSYATDETLDDATIELLLPVLENYGPTWAGPYTGDNRLERLRTDDSLRCMWEDDAPSASCVRHYLSELLLHGVFFRPAREDELDRLAAFTTSVLADEKQSTESDERTHSITRIVTAAEMMTGALFRTELGEGTTPGDVDLSNWELGQELAYAIGNRAPGATPSWIYPDFSAPPEGHLADIAAAAGDGTIRDDAKVQKLLRDNAGGSDPKRFDLIQDFNENRRSRRGAYWLADGMAGFFREWLGYGNLNEVFKDRPHATSQFDVDDDGADWNEAGAYQNLLEGYYGYESLLVQQLDDMIAKIVLADQDVFKNLLTSREFYVAAPGDYSPIPHHIYNLTSAVGDDRDARWVTLPANERAGVLTHPAWLAAHGGNFEDDPSIVHRGKWVRESLLCGYVPPLGEVRVRAVVGPHAKDKSARARLDDATAGSAECMGCHQLMNSLGYPFEIYNHAGFVRAKDHAPDGNFKAPDGSSVLERMPDPSLPTSVKDAVDMSEQLSTSKYAKRCFLRQTFRYYMGRSENVSDACTLARMETAYDEKHGSFLEAVQALMTSDTWKRRRVPGGGP